MTDWLVGLLLLLGGALMLLAAVGVLRMPDVFTRMHAATKPAVLGIGLIATGVALHFGDVGVMTRAILVIGFFVLTAPVAAHMIGRAAYFVGVPLWERTTIDDLSGQYDPRTHRLGSHVTPSTGHRRKSEPGDATPNRD